mgnify:CR=1 FL=1
MTKKWGEFKVDEESMWTTEDQRRIYSLMPQKAAMTKTKWRPAINEGVWIALETAFKLDCSVVEACNIAGIHKSTYYKYLEANPEMELRMKRAMDYPKMLARAAVQHAISRGDGKLAMKYLELRDPRFRWEEDESEEFNNKEALVDFTIVQWMHKKEVKAPVLIENNNDSQSDTEQKSASELSVTFWKKTRAEEKSEEKIAKLQEKIQKEQKKIDEKKEENYKPVWYEDPETLQRLGLLSSNNGFEN